jgi:DNA-binding transcriptional LysR family regulator
MNSSPDWDGLRVFLAVAERRSFSAGARALNISQPTAGRRVEALEKSLGVRLLVRQNRGAVPTPVGEEVLAEARRMSESARAAVRRASGEEASSPVVRVAVTEGLGTRWLPSRLAAHRIEGVRLELVVDNATTDAGPREADVALRLFKPRQPNLVTRRVATLGFGLFAAPSYLAARGTPRRLIELRRHQHVGVVERGRAVSAPLQWHRKLAPKEQFVVSSSSLLSMAELARAGFGITVATIALYERDAGLVRVLPGARPPRLEVWLTTHGDLRRDSAVMRVTEVLTMLFKNEAASLAG